MVLRKPYAFFIKMFKPIHILLAIIVAYLIYLENRILLFFNTYIYSSNNVLGQNIKDKFGSSLLYLLPTIIIIFSLIILGIMFRKKKPIVFYSFQIPFHFCRKHFLQIHFIHIFSSIQQLILIFIPDTCFTCNSR